MLAPFLWARLFSGNRRYHEKSKVEKYSPRKSSLKLSSVIPNLQFHDKIWWYFVCVHILMTLQDILEWYRKFLTCLQLICMRLCIFDKQNFLVKDLNSCRQTGSHFISTTNKGSIVRVSANVRQWFSRNSNHPPSPGYSSLFLVLPEEMLVQELNCRVVEICSEITARPTLFLNSALKSLSKRSHNFNHQQYFNELRIIWGKIGFLIAIPLSHASNVFSAKILMHLLRLVNFKSYLKKGLSFTVLLLNENLMNYFVKILWDEDIEGTREITNFTLWQNLFIFSAVPPPVRVPSTTLPKRFLS